MIGAAVDVGSNSVHLLVASLTDGRLETLIDVSEQLGLGDFVDSQGQIPDAPQRGLVYLLRQYRDLALSQGAKTVTFLGTEPLRRAANGDPCIDSGAPKVFYNIAADRRVVGPA